MSKIIVDILMFIAVVLEFSKLYLSPLVHELLGICIFILMIVHLSFNKKYIKNIFKKKKSASELIMFIINICVFASIMISIISGILISEVLFKSFSKYNTMISKIHIISSYVSIMSLGLHLGLNLKFITSKFKIFKNNIFGIILQLIMICCGIYSIYKSNFFSYLFGVNFFSNKDLNLFMNSALYCSIFLFFAVVMYNINKFLLKIKL